MHTAGRLFRHSVRWLAIVGILLPLGASAIAAPEAPARKPYLYTLTMNYSIPREKWGEMKQQQDAVSKVLDKALNSGRISGYGFGQYLFHSEGDTHRVYFSGKSAGDVLGVWEDLKDAGLEGAPVLNTATGYQNRFYYSYTYDWKPSVVKNGYMFEAIFDFNSARGPDVVYQSTLNGMFEEFLATGGIEAYQFSTECGIHTVDNQHRVLVQYVAKDRNFFDRFVAEADKHFGKSVVVSASWQAVSETTGHRDFLSRGNFAYK